MAFFALSSEVTIGDYTFTGVHEVRIKKGVYGYSETATIELPSIGWMKRGNVVEGPMTVGSLFADGDRVVIKLGYNGELRTEFEGFVKRRNLAMPLLIECEGYVRQLRLNVSLNKNYAKVSVKKLLGDVLAGTDIKLQCPVDFNLSGMRMVNADGCRVIDHVKRCSDNTLTVFFIEPKVLWCGLLYTPYLAGTSVFGLPTVNYRLGYNVVKDNGLKERVPSEPVQIIINGQLANGDPVRTVSKDKVAARKVKYLLNNVGDTETLKAFANEKQYQANYTGYEGVINGFLQPYCAPGWNAYIEDARYPERNGTYVVVSTEVVFGVRGARRIVHIGPKLS